MTTVHGRVVKGVGHHGYDVKAIEAGGREFDPRPGHYSRMTDECLVQPDNWYGFLI